MEKIVFFGTSNNSVTVLEKVINSGYDCASVITGVDKPIGRKQILTPSSVKIFALKNNIPVLSVSNVSDLGNLVDLVTFAVVADFGLLIPIDIIRLFPKGIVNIHPSLLPAYQGATPVPFQILRGEKEGGVTIITINEKFDQGKIIAQEKFTISEIETTESLLAKGFTYGADLLVKILPDYLSNKIKPTPQDLSKKTYFPRLTRDDGFIEWNILTKAMEGKSIIESENPKFAQIAQIILKNPSISIERLIRAFTPWPSVWTQVEINGLPKRLKLLKSHIEGEKLVLDLIQLEGKNPVSFEQFSKAYKI